MLLMLCMVVSLLPSTAFAAEGDTAETPDQEQCAQLPGSNEETQEEDLPLDVGPGEEPVEELTEEPAEEPAKGDEENVQSTPASEPSAQEEPAAEQEGVYPVATVEEFAAAITEIGASEQTEATIVLGADLTNDNGVDIFEGVEGKKITITSGEGATHTLHIPDECVLKGDVSLDRVKLSASDYTGIYACGHTFETTADFEGKINAVYGGGPKGHDITGDTNIVLRGGDVNYLHGGGHDSVVSGDVSILIDGSVHIGTLYGGGHAEETASGAVSGNVTVNMRQGTNGLFFGGGHNAYSKTDNEGDRDPGSVLGTVIVTFGYDGAPDKSVRPGESTFTYGGSYHSTVGNVVLNVTDGFTTEDPLGDRNLFGCGYNDTVLGTVEIHVYGRPDIGDSHIYGGGATESQLGDSWPVRILNQANKESALYITYDVPSEVTAAADQHGINAGSDDSIPMTIRGNVLVEVLGENMDYIVMDNEDFGSCTIDGTCTIRIANGGIIGQIQNNWKHFYGDDATGADNDRAIYDGCGTADNPQISGYLYGFGEVVLQNNAHVLVSSLATGDFDSAQKPFYSVYGLAVEEGSALKTTDAQARVSGNTVVNGVWEQAYIDTSASTNLRVDGTLTVGSTGQLISLGTTYVVGNVSSQGTIALMNPAWFRANYTGADAQFRLPAVAAGNNYDGTDDGGVIPLNIDGAASGATMVYTVSPTDWKTLQKPVLGDNYITASKQEGDIPLQEIFLLGNEDALRDSLYLKRVDDPGVYDNSYFMWQVAKGITVIFDKNGGDTEADPKVITVECVVGQTEYTPGIPQTPPIRAGYEFTGWNTKADGTGDAYGADTKIGHSMTVYAQWKEIIAKYTVTYDLNGGDANGKDYSPVTVDSGTEVIVKGAPARDGYTFNGWSDGTNTYQPGDVLTVTGNITLTAQWRKTGGGGGESTTYYILHYESNGGTKYKDERYAKNTVVQLDKVPVREGYQFTGWYADKELTERITSIKMTSDKTVYAGWRKATVPDMLNGDDHFAYVIGYTDGTVRPNANISRSEVAAIFFRLLKPEVRDGNLTSFNTFTDVNEGMWCNKSISTMAALNIVKGRSAERFDPDAPITRAEFAAICARFDTGMTEGDSNFTDISGHWAEAEIERAASLGWIMGYTDGTFRPDNYITRAEAMTMINRVLCRIPEDEDDLLPGMNVWPDNQPGAWYYLAVQEATNSHDFRYRGEIYEHWIKLTTDPDWTRYQD